MTISRRISRLSHPTLYRSHTRGELVPNFLYCFFFLPRPCVFFFLFEWPVSHMVFVILFAGNRAKLVKEKFPAGVASV